MAKIYHPFLQAVWIVALQVVHAQAQTPHHQWRPILESSTLQSPIPPHHFLPLSKPNFTYDPSLQLNYLPQHSSGYPSPRGQKRPGLFYQTQTGTFQPSRNSIGGINGRRASTPTAQARAQLGVPLSRTDPEFADLKAGPLFLKLDALSTRLAYTDFDSKNLDPPSDDGWISIWELTGRAFLELTDDLSLTVAGSIYYLPLEGEAGIDLTASSRSFARLDWFGHIGTWDLHAFDEFRVFHRANDLLDPIEVDEIDQAGRYRFGRPDDQYTTNRFFNDDSLVYSNLLSFQASNLLTAHNSISLTYQREDYWQSTDFEDHRERDRFEARIENGGSIPFSPYFSYIATTDDRWDSIRHRIWHGGQGRLTENLRAFARVGYHWSTGEEERGRDRLLYEAGLVHDINLAIRHSLFGGQIYTENRFGDEGLYKYLRYTVAHHAKNGVTARAFAGVYDRDDNDPNGDHTRWLLGASAHIPLRSRTSLRLFTRHEMTERPQDADSNRWIHGASLTRQLSSRLHADLSYRYEDYRRPNANFTEHLASFGLTFTF